MQRLAALLANPVDLAVMSDDDLAVHRDDLVAAAAEGRAQGSVNSETLGLLNAAVAEAAAIDAELTSRRTEAEQNETDADAALAKLGVPRAASQRRAMVRSLTVPERFRPRASRGMSSRPMIVASGSPDGSARYADEVELGSALLKAADDARRSPGTDGAVIRVASVNWGSVYENAGAPTVRANASADDNGLALQRAADAHIERMRGYSDLRIASGGVVGPPEPDYAIQTWGSADRPLRDALPSIMATRGEIVFNIAPTIEAILVDTSGGAIGAVTSAQDLASATKTVQEITAPTPNTVVVEAEVLRFSKAILAIGLRRK
jgi:hypothetical protein